MKTHHAFWAGLVTLLTLLSPVRAATSVSITEFMAANASTLADEDGDYPDWIELHNDGAVATNLAGWFLTDDPLQLDKWRFPDANLAPNGYLVVFASNKDRRTPGQPLHTDFKLSAERAYLALVAPDGVTVVSAYAPYPSQVPDISYGVPIRQTETNLISAGAIARVLIPTDGSLDTSWTTPVFNDAGWMSLPTGIGYEADGAVPFAPATIGNSLVDFSGVQGQDGWSYGYWNKKADPDGVYSDTEFVPFPNSGPFGAGNYYNGAIWDWFNGDPPFTQVGREGARPTGSKGSGALPDHWAVRRYVCESNGPIRITGSLSHTSDWVYVTATGVASSSILYIYMQGAGEGFIDDIKVVAGTVPEVGANLLPNGDFESGVLTPWTVSANLSGSSVSPSVRHSGTRSLRVASTASGSSQNTAIWQTLNPGLGNQTYTLSYWYRPSTNSAPLVVRFSGSWIATTPTYCGDGVVGRIFVDGVQVYQQKVFVSSADFALLAPAQVGSRVDFALDAGDANDGDCDGARFSGRIETSDPTSVVVADSTADWSVAGTQGSKNWYYGYYNRSGDAQPPYQTSKFVAFPRNSGPYGASNFWNGAAWRWYNGDPPFDQIAQTIMVPTGTNSGIDHWAIRRWVSEVSGRVTVDWSIAKQASGGNGVTGRILHNGVQRDAFTIAGTDLAGVTRNLAITNVQVGDFIDVVLDAIGRDGLSEDTSDAALVTVSIHGSPSLSGQIASDIRAAMQNVNASAYLRLPFTVGNPAAYNFLSLRLKHDDGFIAYLNGALVASRNAPLTPAWNSAATTARSDADALEFEEINLTSYLGVLQQGVNVLAIHGLNASAGDSDFLILPELVASSVTADVNARRYFSTPTPGAANGIGQTNLGPLVFSVTHTPNVPIDSQDLAVTAYLLPTFNPLGTVQLIYRANYGSETTVPMFDDGQHGDGTASDGIYGATIPASASTPGQMVRYYISAGDNMGNLSRYPAFENPTDSPQYLGTVVQNFSLNNPLPVLHMFVVNPVLATNYSGTRGSLFYDGEFYDNIEVNLHGQTTAAVFRNPGMDVNLNTGHKFRWSHDAPRLSDFTLLTCAPDKAYMRNILAFESFAAAGVPTHVCVPVRLQANGQLYGVMHFVDSPDNEYLKRLGLDENGALYKVYLPLTNAYGGVVEKKTRKTENNADLQALIDGLRQNGNALRNFLYDNVDIPEALNMLATIQHVQNEDCCWYKNYYMFRDTSGSGEWQIHPWDLDLTFGRVFVQWIQNPQGIFGGYYDTNIYSTNLYYWQIRSARDYIGNSQPLADALWSVPEIYEMFHRRWSTVAEDLLQKAGTPVLQLKYETRIDQLAAQIGPDAAQDLAKWGTWPYSAPVVQSLPQAVSIMKTQWLAQRRLWIFNNRAYTNDGSYVGQQPLNAGLAIGTIDYNPSSHNQAEEYVQIRNPNAYPMDISGWQVSGGIEHTFKPGTVIPTGGILYLSPDVKSFRARALSPRGGQGLFIQGNYHGQLSARGEPLQITDRTGRLVLTTNYPSTPSAAQQYLRITELMYHPAPMPGITSDPEQLEYVELRNTGPTALDLRGVHFTNGLEFVFTTPSLAAGDRILVVKNLAAFTARYGGGHNIAGVYTGSLDNGGENLQLDDTNGEKILDFSYNNSWYPITDGLGFSLVIVNDAAPWDTWGEKTSWRPSGSASGSPGAGDTLLLVVAPILVNEIATHTVLPDKDLIELHNPTATNVNVGGWFVTDDFGNPKKYRIANGVSIPARDFLVIGEDQFNPGGTGFALSSDGDEVYLFSGDATTNLTGYYQGFSFGAAAAGVNFGRYVNSQGETHFVAQSANTPGSSNALPRVGPVVVSEIMYHPPDLAGGVDDDRDEYIELQNISGTDVPLFDPARPANTWRLRDAVDFDFPTNITLPAGGRLLMVSFNPATNGAALFAFRSLYGIGPEVTLLGPWQGKLDNSDDEIELQRPSDPVGGAVPYILVEEVHYRDTNAWPALADGVGNSLQRLVVSRYGNDPTNWVAGGLTPGSSNVFNRVPTVAVISPTNGTVLQLPVSVTLRATATDADGTISRVEFFDGATSLGELMSAPYDLAWNSSVPGEHLITVKARDNAGAISVSAPVSITLIPQRPTAAITSPADGAVLTLGTTTTITATASPGSQPLAAVDFRADGVLLNTIIAPPYSTSWMPGPGPHVLQAIATDVAGASGTSAVVNVVVLNVVNSNVVMFPTNTTWAYNDKGQDLGTAWQQLGYNDAGWSNGCAQLGYGESDECTSIQYGGISTNRYITYYFRKKFTVNSFTGITNAVLRVLRDDGAVAYLNGVEVFRSNMPQGPPNYKTRASTAVAGPDEGTFYPTNLNLNLLQLGINVLAVEVHQSASNSSDMSFAADLVLNQSVIAPRITIQPLSQTKGLGESAVFSITASGTTPLDYQWYRNDLALPGEKSATLTIPSVTANTAGSYSVVVTNAAGIAASSIATLTIGSPDSDGDGMPDDWELAHSLNPALNDAALDADLDGMTNLQEYRAGTDPQNGASVLRVTSITLANGGAAAVLTFNAAANKSYSVLAAPLVQGGAWLSIQTIGAGPSARLVTVTNVLTGDQQRFYRLSTP